MKTSNKFDIKGSVVAVKIVSGSEADKNLKVWEEMEFDASTIPAELADGDGFKTLAAYGLASLLQDRAASFNDKALGDMGLDGAALVRARMERYQETYDMLLGGTFSERSKGGGAKGGAVDAFFAQGFSAWLKTKGKDVDATVASLMLTNMKKEERDALKKHAEISVEIAKARKDAQEAANGFDLSALLGGE